MYKREFDYIDTLRFLAIFFIVFAHFDGECFNYFMHSTVTEKFFFPGHWLSFILFGHTGKYALAILCIISGFLTAMKYYREEQCDVGAFVIGRYLRLMVPVLFTDLVFWAYLLCTGGNGNILDYIRPGLTPGNMGINRNLWCIGAFFIGNLIVCLLCYLKNRTRFADWLYLPVLGILALMGQIWVFAAVAGGLSYVVAAWCKEKDFLRCWHLVGIIPILWLLIRGYESDFMYYRDILAGFIIMISFYCLPVLQKIFAFKHIRWIKKKSYSLFIVHGMTLFIVGPVWNLIQSWGITGYYSIFITMFLMVFLFDFGIAVVVYYLAEVKICGVLQKVFLPSGRVAYQGNEE